MKRLVVFGCSITEGCGLENPEQERWSQLLSEYLNLELVNNGIVAGSNKLITHSIANFEFKYDDLVIVQWTFKDRTSILKSKDEYNNCIPQLVKHIPECKTYYRDFHHDYDTMFMFKVFVEYSINLLIQEKVKYRQFFVSKQNMPDTPYTKLNAIPFFYREIHHGHKLAPDGKHVGKEGNAALASVINASLHSDPGHPKNII